MGRGGDGEMGRGGDGEMGRGGDGERGRWGDGEMGRWGDGEMGRWGDGESTLVRRNTTVERSGEPVTLTSRAALNTRSVRRAGEMGR